MTHKRFSHMLLRGMTAIILSGMLAVSSPASALPAHALSFPDPHYLQSGAPMADLDLGKYSGFTLGDVDGDGDTDSLVGDVSGRLVYYRNAGGPHIGASYYRELDSRYPLGLGTQAVNYSDGLALTYLHPELVDNDGDGDKDLFIAAVDRNPDRVVTPTLVVDYYQNQGSYFQKVSGGGGNVPSITWIPNWGCHQDYDYAGQGFSSLPWNKEIITFAAGDLNGDGATDGVVGIIFDKSPTEKQYELRIYMGVKPNLGVKQCPQLISNYASLPQELRLPGARPFPELHDADADGDLDLFVGLSSGVVRYFENTGTIATPAFTLRKGELHPLNPLDTTDPSAEPDFGAYVVPEFGNLTLDKSSDFAALSGDGQVISMYYDYAFEVKHLVPWLTPADFLVPLDAGGRIVGFDEGAGVAAFTDLDGDGDPDALVGGKDGAIRNYKNLLIETGQRNFVELLDTNRWFPANAGAFRFGAPLLANFDGQAGDAGDVDLVISAKVTTCPDISTGTGGLLSAEESMLPPDVAPDSPPMSLAADGDVWRLCYYENEGSSTQPDFQLNASPESGDRYDPFINTETGLPLLDSGQYLLPAVVAADSYETFPDLIIGSKAGGLIYLHNLGDTAGPSFVYEPADLAALGLDTLSIAFGAPVFLDVDNDTSPDLVVGSGDGQVRYFHNDQAADDPGNGINNPIGPFTEITGADNPFSFLNTGQYAAPTFTDLDSDGDQDLALGSVLNAFRFYENVTPPGGSNPLAYVNYRVNPLGSVAPPDYSATFYRSVNFADVDGDGDLDAFVGNLHGIEYYLNIGQPQAPVFRLQPIDRNPLRDVPDPVTIINVSFADTHPAISGIEAYVGARSGGKGYLKAYQFDPDEQKYVVMSNDIQPFYRVAGYYTNYEVGTRAAFVYNQDTGCLNAYITMGSFAATGYNSYYAVNQFLCEGFDDETGNPIYSLPTNTLSFDENIGSGANPFYNLNWPPRHYFTGGEWNGSLVGSETLWFGNGLGEVHTLVNGFYDAGNDAYYFDRITDHYDPFKNVKLPSPTIPTAADTNADDFVDAYIGSSNGTIQYFVGSATLPPSGPDLVHLPLIVSTQP